MDAIRFIVETLLRLAILAFVLRFVLQQVRADFYNPFSQAILKITNPLVLPARRFIPGWRGIDIAGLVVILVLQVAATMVMLGLYGLRFPGWLTLLTVSAIELLQLVLQFYFFALLVYALMSWFGPQARNPLGSLLASICEPLLRPVRRIVPPLGGLDLSVLVLLILIQALLIAVR